MAEILLRYNSAMTYFLVKAAHVLGAFWLFAALGSIALRQLGTTPQAKDRAHKLSGLTHGLSLVLILVTGFWILGIMKYDFSLWVWLKLGIWLLLGASIAVVRRTPKLAALWWWLLPLLGAVAAWLCFAKPS